MKKITAILASVMLIFAMAMPAFAETYVESITAKPAPGVVESEGDIIGEIFDENGNKVADIHEGDLVITGITDKDQLSDEAKAALEKALKEITDGTAVLPQELIDLLGDNLVAKDLFDVTAVSADLIDYLATGHSIRFTLDANLAADALVGVASYVDGKWVAATECINNGDGTITVTLPAICPVGIFVEGEAADPVEPGTTAEPTDPTDGDVTEGDCKICKTFFPYLGAAPIFNGVCIICFVLVVVAVCAVCYIVYRVAKKGKDEEKK